MELGKVNEWAKNNGLAIIPLKSKCLFIFKKTLCNNELFPVTINKTPIEYVETANNLGGKTYGLLRSLPLVKCSLPVNVRLLIAKSCLIPTLFYGLGIYANCDVVRQHKLKIAYNIIARVISHARDHVSQFSYKIFDISLVDYMKSRTIVLLHKVIYTRKPSYLKMKKIVKNNNSPDLQEQRILSESDIGFCFQIDNFL